MAFYIDDIPAEPFVIEPPETIDPAQFTAATAELIDPDAVTTALVATIDGSTVLVDQPTESVFTVEGVHRLRISLTGTDPATAPLPPGGIYDTFDVETSDKGATAVATVTRYVGSVVVVDIVATDSTGSGVANPSFNLTDDPDYTLEASTEYTIENGPPLEQWVVTSSVPGFTLSVQLPAGLPAGATFSGRLVAGLVVDPAPPVERQVVQRLPDVRIVVQDLDSPWHTLDSIREEWADAEAIPDPSLWELLDLARGQVLEFAPALIDADGNPLPVPARYRDGQRIQARNVWNASKVSPDGGIGGDDFVIRPFPLDWHVKQILRPKHGIPVIA